MIRILTAAAVALLSASAAFAQDEDVTVIHAGWLLAVPGEQPEREQSIIIRGERIEAVEDGYVTPEGATVMRSTPM